LVLATLAMIGAPAPAQECGAAAFGVCAKSCNFNHAFCLAHSGTPLECQEEFDFCFQLCYDTCWCL
jgi:hypothetical protein